MDKRILSAELIQHIGSRVKVQGWLNNVRALGGINFLLLRDRLGLIQVVVVDKVEIAKIIDLQPGSVITVYGKAIESAKAELGLELIDPQIEVEVPIKIAPPLEYYKPQLNTNLEFILDHRPVALRNREIQAVFKIQAEIAHAYRLYMHDVVKAVEYFSPNMLGASSEGGAEFFNVDYFGYTATLAQSSQLYKQIMVGVNERVFATAPFFRAENSHTTRHISEGKQLEFEMGFFAHWQEVMDVQEGAIKYILKFLHEHAPKEIALLGGEIIAAPEEVPIPRITFARAQELYFERTGIDERDEPDLSPAAEKELCSYAKEQWGTDLIFITDWRRAKRPFYAFPSADDPDLTNTFDLLCAGTEITSGGQRRHTYESMLEGILEKGMDPDNFIDYLEIFKYGMPVHGGFGMGLERLTMTILKLKNIREASLFPSDPKRIAGVRLKARLFFGGENIRNEIIHLLKDHDFTFTHLEHESTTTSEDSARVRGTALEEGIKSIILRGKNSKKNYQVNFPSHLKLDMKAVAALVGEKCEFEEPQVIKERFGLEIGSVPPFGNLLNLDVFFDEGIKEQARAAFNCGLTRESILMRTQDLIQLVMPRFGQFTKTAL